MYTVALAVPTRPVQAKIGNVSEKDEELAIAQKKLADMKKEVSLKTKELQDRGNGLETIDKKSLDVEVGESCIAHTPWQRSNIGCCLMFVKVPTGLLLDSRLESCFAMCEQKRSRAAVTKQLPIRVLSD